MRHYQAVMRHYRAVMRHYQAVMRHYQAVIPRFPMENSLIVPKGFDAVALKYFSAQCVLSEYFVFLQAQSIHCIINCKIIY
jgi:hypothetical protein